MPLAMSATLFSSFMDASENLADIDCFIATDTCLPAKDFTYLFHSAFSSFLPATARYLLTSRACGRGGKF